MSFKEKAMSAVLWSVLFVIVKVFLGFEVAVGAMLAVIIVYQKEQEGRGK